jgi:hypothetical protein
MPVQLKRTSSVIESLRASRRAVDEADRLRHRSLEEATQAVRKLVEQSDWKHGPAELIATFQHHAVCRTTRGNLVRVEWHQSDDHYTLGNAKAFESQTPAVDIGSELFATARAAAQKILEDETTDLAPMIASITEALDTTGDLRRRIDTELALRSIKRDAWWHGIVADALEVLISPPAPRTEGAELIANSARDLATALRAAASSAATALRALDETSPDAGLTNLAQDIAHDITNATSALMSADTANETELVGVYETVHSVASYLLSGAEFLTRLAGSTTQE